MKIASYGVFTILRPIQETVSSFGIVIQGDDNTPIARGKVVSGGSHDPNDEGTYLHEGVVVYYRRNGAHPLPGTDLVAVHDDTIVAFEYDDGAE